MRASITVSKISRAKNSWRSFPLKLLTKGSPDSRTWSFRLRRPLLALPKPDVALIDRELRRVARPVEETLGEYLALPTLPATPLTLHLPTDASRRIITG